MPVYQSVIFHGNGTSVCREGDGLADHESPKAALQTLYEQYADDIFRFAVYTLRSEADAMDTVQETFLRAYRSWDSFRGEAGAKTWLFRIAKNYMVDLRRKRQTAVRFAERQSVDAGGVANMNTDIEVQELLAKLPPIYREVLLLRAVEGLSVAETAHALRLTETNVRVTYHRAKKQLDHLLASAEATLERRPVE